ncbi:MAG: RNA-directed DNA polymerase [Verrucomicrobiae bacterium]|nr:RNA-directed DNA polymerase [Verrucomicrobiae bacterium]
METWSTHHLYNDALAVHDTDTALEIRSYAQNLITKGHPVVFSLEHLSRITHVSYAMLRATIERNRESANYRMFAVSKRSGGLRFIHAVTGDLQIVQRFINQEILQNCRNHPASFAFHSSGGIRKCAAQHCGAKWLFQFDLSDFFYAVNEAQVFRIFREMGYRELLAFELGRLCTTTRLPRNKHMYLKWRPGPPLFPRFGGEARGEGLPYPQSSGQLGVLPQGAPTSPMLSNLAAGKLDESLSAFANDLGFVYTRYADDITISATNIPRGVAIGTICHRVIDCIRKAGFTENREKIRIAGPGSKKVVLGLLVDGPQPRISRETYKRIDRHLHAAKIYGLEATAQHEGFDSAFGFHNHLTGLVRFVHDVDLKRWADFSQRLTSIEVPWQAMP